MEQHAKPQSSQDRHRCAFASTARAWREPVRRRALLRDALSLLLLCIISLILLQWLYRTPRSAFFTVDTPAALLPRSGLYEIESFADRPGIYRWSNGAGQIKLPNAGGPLQVRLLLAGGPGRTVEAQMQVNGRSFDFAVRPEPRVYTIGLAASAGERLTLMLNSPTLRERQRDLGVVVSNIAILGGGSVPCQLQLALQAATIGVYVLLRQAGWRRFAATGTVLALQILTVLWQSGGWIYALFGTLLALVGVASLGAALLDHWQTPIKRSNPTTYNRQHADHSVALALVLLALCIRLPWLAAADPVGDLELSARRIESLRNAGLAGAYREDGDYMPLRIYWLYGFSTLPFLHEQDFREPLPTITMVLIKLPGLLADLITVALIYFWCRRWCTLRSAALLTILYALAPPIWMNVAWWGQVDAILMLPVLAMLVLLDRAGGRWSWLCWTIALLIKPQAIIFAPVLAIATLRKYGSRGLVQGGAIAAGLIVLTCAPLVLAQQGPGLLEAYVGSVGRFPQLTNRAYNLWYLVTLGAGGADTGQGLGPISWRVLGMSLVGLVTVLMSIALWQRADGTTHVESAALMALAFFTLPTQIHERYLFLSLALLLMSAASDRRLLSAYGLIGVSATINILGTLRGFSLPAYLWINTSPLPLLLSALNIVVLLALLVHLLVRNLRQPRTLTPQAYAK